MIQHQKKPFRSCFRFCPCAILLYFRHDCAAFCGARESIRALEDVMADDKELLLVSQKDGDQDDPEPADMHEIGTVGSVLQMLKLPDGTVKSLVEGNSRARVLEYLDNEAFLKPARWRWKMKLAMKPS
ncbi:MAG: hypothetical protein CM15mP21_2760 [Hyphomicrobiales bacterium]|nr:MAG: hypothetical protein CM15mP21_2760 [Hyphomicrobiales bacterium]